ncbi:hypothetical protein B0H19DRAFT_1060024 [Mycena capillaripes]|nr:hypothetical protein B0H19DRAFT_1060024 [Mycena capillaripes]
MSILSPSSDPSHQNAIDWDSDSTVGDLKDSRGYCHFSFNMVLQPREILRLQQPPLVFRQPKHFSRISIEAAPYVKAAVRRPKTSQTQTSRKIAEAFQVGGIGRATDQLESTDSIYIFFEHQLTHAQLFLDTTQLIAAAAPYGAALTQLKPLRGSSGIVPGPRNPA